MGFFNSQNVITALSTLTPRADFGIMEDKHQFRYLQNPIPLKLWMTNLISSPDLWWSECDYQSDSWMARQGSFLITGMRQEEFLKR